MRNITKNTTIYRFIPHRLHTLEFILDSLGENLREFLIKNGRAYTTRNDMLILYHGSNLVLDYSEGSNGLPMSITIPQGIRLAGYSGILTNNVGRTLIKLDHKVNAPFIIKQVCRAFSELSQEAQFDAADETKDQIKNRGSPYLVSINYYTSEVGRSIFQN
jgi:hypothetical protein